MAHVKLTEHVDAPIERVFEWFANANRWPEWMPGIVEIKEVTGPLDTVGTRVREVSQFLGRKMESLDEVVEVERPRYMKLASKGEGATGTGTFRLTTSGRGTDIEVESSYEVPAGFFGHIADRLFIERMMERQMRHAAENLKALVELEAAVPV